MKDLFAVCQAKRKIWRTIPNGSHNDTVAEPDYFRYVYEFIQDQVLGGQ